MDLIAVSGEDAFKGAEVFEVDMPDGRSSFHGETAAL
jgi:hypothetical protein